MSVDKFTALELPPDAEDVQVENAPVRRHQHGPYTIEGYSRTAVQTYLRRARAQDRVRFWSAAMGFHDDPRLGRQSCSTWIISPPCRSMSPAGG